VLVTSGYNNVSLGDGHGHLYVLDALTGAILAQTATPDTGNNTTPIPSGLAKIAVMAPNATVDNTGTAVYGGDLLGNIWKFDLTSFPATVQVLGQAKDLGGKPQPITTSPELALVQDIYKVVYVGTGRYLGNADLTDPATQSSPVPSPITAWKQSLYAFKDTGTNLGTLRTAGLVKQTLTTSGGGTQRTVTNTAVNFATQTGWYVDFDLTDSPGERVTLDPQLVLGTLNVTTNVPNTTACTAGGDAWSYQFNYLTGSFVSTSPGGVVGAKQTGALAVGLVIYQLQKGSVVLTLQLSNTVQVQPPAYTNPGTNAHRRTSWRELTR
jgi:type IV pilus assembly protein PilY1